MSINAVCTACGDRNIDHLLTICPSCGSKLSGKFRVRVKATGGRWKSKTVSKLSIARVTEAQFKMTVEVPPDDSPTLTTVWLLYHESVCRRKKSIEDDAQRMRDYLAPKLGSLRLDQIKPGMITGILDDMESRGKAPATRLTVLALLSVMFNWAMRRDLCLNNPCRRVERPKVDNVRTRVLSREEVERFLEVLKTWPSRPTACLLKFLLFTGLRRGQARGLLWEWVDLEQGVISFPKNTTKNGKGQTLPLNSAAMEVLKGCRGYSPVRVFIGQSDVSRAFQTVCRLAKIEGAVLHDLRRTFGSWAVSNGVDLYTVSKLLNHSGVGVTERIYAHLNLETLRKGVDVVGKALSGG
jgi:integrase